ncbi:MAG TPA: 50S ribosomal protein L1 [Candidatus Sabulitectum sp.]|nr:50S ribosomal protein L1 [Candidatus Sabulitectum sp.]HPJ29657.1 50S ribosomal protein L1 [Candidatus Sabulitectum sp.]HPR21720.1 50S ribosomal protein L1 [Candidatus Sabulitectum sp.]
MAKSRRFARVKEAVDRQKYYTLEESITSIKKLATAKFDETIEVALNLGVNPKYSDQVVRGTCMLPHGTGKTVRVLAFARGEKAEEAKAAGADFIGDEETAQKITEGWTDFDVVIASPDMMGVVGKLGRVLGPRGLMPNPKTGTVTPDVGAAVKDAKGGKISFRVDKTGNLHVPVGKASFEEQALKENILSVMEKVIQLKPASTKGKYINNMAVSSTMGPGIRVDVNDVRSLLR